MDTAPMNGTREVEKELIHIGVLMTGMGKERGCAKITGAMSLRAKARETEKEAGVHHLLRISKEKMHLTVDMAVVKDMDVA